MTRDLEGEMQKALMVAGLAVIGLLAAALAGVGLPEDARGENVNARTVTVTGTGIVETQPDEAAFTFGVESRAASAREASEANAAAMRRLIDALKAAGVRDEDLQTQHVSVWPAGKPEGGYTASNSVAVSTSVDRAGRLVEVATGAGANTLSGPALSRSESHELEERALERALEDARRKAEALAAAADARLGVVVRLVEGGGPQPYPEYRTALAATDEAAAPIEGGTLEQQATLTVTFSLQ